MEKDMQFSKIIYNYWHKQRGRNNYFKNKYFEIFISDNLNEGFNILTLEFLERPNWVIIRPKFIDLFKIEEIQHYDFMELLLFLSQQHITLHGADYVFYFSEKEKLQINNMQISEGVRALTNEDLKYFSEFETAVTPQDLDAAYVSLDDWKVYGSFKDNKLVAIASMYPWENDEKIADLGVVTLTDYRGKGIAQELVYAISKSAIQQGYEPQYRCQLDNLASVGLAKKLKMNLFALWNVNSQE
jgi:RimJ/RimL family protein N-acetyltransferase